MDFVNVFVALYLECLVTFIIKINQLIIFIIIFIYRHEILKPFLQDYILEVNVI